MDHAPAHQRDDHARSGDARADGGQGELDAQAHQRRDQRARPRTGPRQRDGDKQEKAQRLIFFDDHGLLIAALDQPSGQLFRLSAEELHPAQDLPQEENDERHRQQICDHAHRQQQPQRNVVRQPIGDRAAQLRDRGHGQKQGKKHRFEAHKISHPFSVSFLSFYNTRMRSSN